MDKLASIVADLSPETKTLLTGGTRGRLFSTAISNILNRMTAGEKIVPPPELILAAFRQCPAPRVVILGQDPYHTAGTANGLSFSAAAGNTVPPSLRNIYKCLLHHKLIDAVPKTPDLSPLCGQGVMLLNCALTTTEGTAGAHRAIWAGYTDALIEELSKTAPIFILLGSDAKAKRGLLHDSCTVYEWGHPSPMSDVNKRDGPLNFINCTAFAAANKKLAELGYPPINYNAIAAGEQYDSGKLYVFTDGGATKNGREDATATWGFYAVRGYNFADGTAETSHTNGGVVPPVDIEGKKYKTSNQRGELMAIGRGLEYIAAYPGNCPVTIISDSNYGINCIGVWVNSWLADETKMRDKCNLDLILPAAAMLKEIRKTRKVDFRHIYSHDKIEPPAATFAWFAWKGNSIADRLCNDAKN